MIHFVTDDVRLGVANDGAHFSFRLRSTRRSGSVLHALTGSDEFGFVGDGDGRLVVASFFLVRARVVNYGV